MGQWVYSFGEGKAEGRADMRDLLGDKGATLAGMCSLGLDVPPGFTLTTEVGAVFHASDGAYPEGLETEVAAGLARVGAATGRRFGDTMKPLLIAVRCGARGPMPGTMDAVLNLGLNDVTVEALAREIDKRFAYDCYRRFIATYSETVLGLDLRLFAERLEDFMDERGVAAESALGGDDWAELTHDFSVIVRRALGAPFPQDPNEQLWGAIDAAFSSSMSEPAIAHRRRHDTLAERGIAVTVQAMAFGNMDDNSGTGVAFTRDPSTGEPVLAGEFLANAQGKDLVAGARAPQDLTEAVRIAAGADKPSLEAAQPKAFANLREACRALEHAYRDMQEVDFTIERGTLWLLRTRSGKRAARAAVTIAVDLADEGLLTRAEAILRVDPAGLDELVRPTGDPVATAPATSSGGPAEAAASPPNEAGALAGESKAAGAAAATRPSQLSGDFAKLMEWADAVRRMRVRANAETLAEARTARACGAEGIGLWRTEQMFRGPDRLAATREMILAGSEAGRRAALQKLLPLQRADFAELFEITRGLPVTVRLLDAPLHAFLPTSDEDIAELATATGVEPVLLRERTLALREVNPLLGRRGARLAIAYPEIAAMQARAIFEAAVDVGEGARTAVEIEIMVPMVTVKTELDILKAVIDETANAIAQERGKRLLYKVGIMIEVPRAAIRAREMAATAEFFSFGTDALTETTFGMSREDAADFLGAYIAGGILAGDPFASLDREGVGELVRRAVERGRAARPGLTIGICGEHGSDPASIAFCEKVGLDYVSCAPDRLLIARLAAAQAALQLSELSDDR